MPVRYGHILEALEAVLKPSGEPALAAALPLGDLVTESADLIGGVDAKGKLRYLNPAGRRLLKLGGRSDLHTLSLRRFFSSWAFERLEAQALPEARACGRWSGEASLLIGGKECPVDLTILAQDDGSLALVARDKRGEARRQRALAALAAPGDLPELLKGLCQALELRQAFIGERQDDRLELVASWGAPLAALESYPLAGSAWRTAMSGLKVYPAALRAHFPGDNRLAALDAESMLGAPLGEGAVLVALHDAPLEDPRELALLFSAFAERAAASLAVREAAALRQERSEQRARVHEELERTREDALRAMGLALEYRDYETKGHTDRVTALSLRLGRALGLPADTLTHLRWGGYLHDAGKIAIADSILLKPGKLEEGEWQTMKSHVTIGEAMISQLGFIPQPVLELVRHHHERWDGKGYPDGLAGERIPLLARIFSLADVYDALVSERPYKRAWSHEEALAEILRGAGEQFDPALTLLFLELWERHIPSPPHDPPAPATAVQSASLK